MDAKGSGFVPPVSQQPQRFVRRNVHRAMIDPRGAAQKRMKSGFWARYLSHRESVGKPCSEVNNRPSFGRIADGLALENAYPTHPNSGRGGRIDMPIRVLLADDSEIILRAVTSILKTDPDIEVVGEARSLRETMELVGRLQPHVVVLDLHIGDENDVPLENVKERLAGSQLVVISIWNDDGSIAIAKSFGAVAYLDKAGLGTRLIPTIKQCMRDRES
jgi:CheY-like chemotaxis protein